MKPTLAPVEFFRQLVVTAVFTTVATFVAASAAQDEPIEGPLEGPIDGEESGDPSDGPDPDAPIVDLPRLTTLVEATYPPRALEEGVEAQVLLEIDIDAEGRVEAVRVLEASGSPGYGFEEAAVAAAQQFAFEPARVEGGFAVPARITYRYGFVLEETETVVEETPDPTAEVGPVAQLSGRLLERGTRDPLVGVVITVFRGEGDEAEGFEALTDEEGRFAFVDLAPGDWKINVETEGYFPYRTTETLNPDEAVDVVFFVERGSYNPWDVLVEAPRPKKEVSRRNLRAQEIERIPGNFGDPIKVVRTLPGVARSFFGSPAIIVRGSGPEDTRVYVDGVLVPLIYHFGGLRSILPLGMVESIDFSPGNFSTYYGQSIGGVLDVELKRTVPEAIHGYVDVNAFDAGVYLEAPVTDTVFTAVGFRRSYIDAVLDFAVPDNAPINIIAAPRYYDGQILTTWQPNREHQLRLFAFGSDDRIEVLFDNPKEFDANLESGNFAANTRFGRIVADHRWTPTNDFENELRLAVGNDIIDASLGNQFFAVFDLVQFTARDAITVRPSSRTSVTTGFDMNIGITDVRIRAPQPRKEGDPDRFGNRDIEDTITVEQNGLVLGGVAGYVELELQALDQLTFVPGFRVEHIEPIEEVVFDPRLVVRYDLSQQWTLKGGVGLFHQPPTPDETAPGFGNPNLGPEEAVHYTIGAEYRPLDYVLIDGALFFKDMNDLVSRTGEVTLEDGDAELLNYNNGGKGRVYGFELLVKHEFANNFFGWITYTLSRAERLDFGESRYRLFDFDQTHILTVIGSYELPYNWTFSLSWRLTSGNPTTPIIGSAFDSDADEYRQILGAANTARLPTFHQLDIRIDKVWVYDTWTFNMYLDVQNVYNRTNTNFYQYNFDFTERRPQQGLPVLPILGVKAEF